MGSFMKPLKTWDQQTKIVPPNVNWLNYIKYLPWFKCKIWIKLIPTNTEFETAPHHQHGIPWCTSSKDFKIILINIWKCFIFLVAMHTQTWVVQLFARHIKHNVVLEKSVARNKKLGGMSWNEKKTRCCFRTSCGKK